MRAITRNEIPQIAAAVFKEFYRDPYIPTHAPMHVARVVLYIPILVNLYRKYGDQRAKNLTDEQIALLQVIALFHDSGRKGDGVDVWEADSAENLAKFLKARGFDDQQIAQAKSVATNKRDHSQRDLFKELLDAADSLDVIRVRRNYHLNALVFYKKNIHNPEAITDLKQMALAIRELIALQKDLKSNNIIWEDEIIVAGQTSATFDQNGKNKYDQSPEVCFSLVEKDLLTFNVLKKYYLEKTVVTPSVPTVSSILEVKDQKEQVSQAQDYIERAKSFLDQKPSSSVIDDLYFEMEKLATLSLGTAKLLTDDKRLFEKIADQKPFGPVKISKMAASAGYCREDGQPSKDLNFLQRMVALLINPRTPLHLVKKAVARLDNEWLGQILNDTEYLKNCLSSIDNFGVFYGEAIDKLREENCCKLNNPLLKNFDLVRQQYDPAKPNWEFVKFTCFGISKLSEQSFVVVLKLLFCQNIREDYFRNLADSITVTKSKFSEVFVHEFINYYSQEESPHLVSALRFKKLFTEANLVQPTCLKQFDPLQPNWNFIKHFCDRLLKMDKPDLNIILANLLFNETIPQDLFDKISSQVCKDKEKFQSQYSPQFLKCYSKVSGNSKSTHLERLEKLFPLLNFNKDYYQEFSQVDEKEQEIAFKRLCEKIPTILQSNMPALISCYLGKDHFNASFLESMIDFSKNDVDKIFKLLVDSLEKHRSSEAILNVILKKFPKEFTQLISTNKEQDVVKKILSGDIRRSWLQAEFVINAIKESEDCINLYRVRVLHLLLDKNLPEQLVQIIGTGFSGVGEFIRLYSKHFLENYENSPLILQKLVQDNLLQGAFNIPVNYKDKLIEKIPCAVFLDHIEKNCELRKKFISPNHKELIIDFLNRKAMSKEEALRIINMKQGTFGGILPHELLLKIFTMAGRSPNLLMDLKETPKEITFLQTQWRYKRQIGYLQKAIGVNTHKEAGYNRFRIPQRLREKRNLISEQKESKYPIYGLSERELPLFEYLANRDLIVQHATSAMADIERGGNKALSVMERKRRGLNERSNTPDDLGTNDTVFTAYKTVERSVPDGWLVLPAYELNLTDWMRKNPHLKKSVWSSEAFYPYDVRIVMPPVKIGGTTYIARYLIPSGKVDQKATKQHIYIHPDGSRQVEEYPIGSEVYRGEDTMRLRALRTIEQIRHLDPATRDKILNNLDDKQMLLDIEQTFTRVRGFEIHKNVSLDVSSATKIPEIKAEYKVLRKLIDELKNDKTVKEIPRGLNLNITLSDGVQSEGINITTVLCAAAAFADVATLERLIQSGADVNWNGLENASPLYCAVAHNKLNNVKFLIEKKSSKSKFVRKLTDPFPHFQRGNWGCWTKPLETAVTKNNPEIVKLLLENHAGEDKLEFSKAAICVLQKSEPWNFIEKVDYTPFTYECLVKVRKLNIKLYSNPGYKLLAKDFVNLINYLQYNELHLTRLFFPLVQQVDSDSILESIVNAHPEIVKHLISGFSTTFSNPAYKKIIIELLRVPSRLESILSTNEIQLIVANENFCEAWLNDKASTIHTNATVEMFLNRLRPELLVKFWPRVLKANRHQFIQVGLKQLANPRANQGFIDLIFQLLKAEDTQLLNNIDLSLLWQIEFDDQDIFRKLVHIFLRKNNEMDLQKILESQSGKHSLRNGLAIIDSMFKLQFQPTELGLFTIFKNLVNSSSRNLNEVLNLWVMCKNRLDDDYIELLLVEAVKNNEKVLKKHIIQDHFFVTKNLTKVRDERVVFLLNYLMDNPHLELPPEWYQVLLNKSLDNDNEKALELLLRFADKLEVVSDAELTDKFHRLQGKMIFDRRFYSANILQKLMAKLIIKVSEENTYQLLNNKIGNDFKIYDDATSFWNAYINQLRCFAPKLMAEAVKCGNDAMVRTLIKDHFQNSDTINLLDYSSKLYCFNYLLKYSKSSNLNFSSDWYKSTFLASVLSQEKSALFQETNEAERLWNYRGKFLTSMDELKDFSSVIIKQVPQSLADLPLDVIKPENLPTLNGRKHIDGRHYFVLAARSYQFAEQEQLAIYDSVSKHSPSELHACSNWFGQMPSEQFEAKASAPPNAPKEKLKRLVSRCSEIKTLIAKIEFQKRSYRTGIFFKTPQEKINALENLIKQLKKAWFNDQDLKEILKNFEQSERELIDNPRLKICCNKSVTSTRLFIDRLIEPTKAPVAVGAQESDLAAGRIARTIGF